MKNPIKTYLRKELYGNIKAFPEGKSSNWPATYPVHEVRAERTDAEFACTSVQRLYSLRKFKPVGYKEETNISIQLDSDRGDTYKAMARLVFSRSREGDEERNITGPVESLKIRELISINFAIQPILQEIKVSKLSKIYGAGATVR